MKLRAVFFSACFTGLFFAWVLVGVAGEEKKGAPAAATVQDQMSVKFDYTLTVDGKVIDSSEGHAPLEYVHGKGQIIPGLEQQMAGMKVGDSKEVTVRPENGYGQVNPEAFAEVPKAQLPQEAAPEVGMTLGGVDPAGRHFQARITEVKDQTVKLDMNHPLAGKTLSFKVKVVEISPAPSAPTE